MEKLQRRSKIEREDFIFDRFRPAFSEFPKGEVVRSESPDYLIRQPNKTIGIEMVDFFIDQRPGGSVAKKKQSDRERFVELAEQAYVSLCSMPATVSLIFTEKQIGGTAKSSADSLAALIHEVIFNLKESEEVDIDRTTLAKFGLNEILWTVEIGRTFDTQLHFIYSNGAVFGDPSDSLHQTIASKEAKYEKYIEKCDEAWLLIIKLFKGFHRIFGKTFTQVDSTKFCFSITWASKSLRFGMQNDRHGGFESHRVP